MMSTVNTAQASRSAGRGMKIRRGKILSRKSTTLVIRGLDPLFSRAFRTLAVMLDFTNADLLVRLMVRCRDPQVREVLRRGAARSS